MKVAKALICSVATFIIATGCQGVQFADANTTDGHHLYTARCAKCHEFYPPQKYSQPEWDKWMTKMRRKARLNDEQFQQLKQYTETLRAATKP